MNNDDFFTVILMSVSCVVWVFCVPDSETNFPSGIMNILELEGTETHRTKQMGLQYTVKVEKLVTLQISTW